MKTMRVSEPVYQTLKEVKDSGKHTSFDSALRQVLHEAGYDPEVYFEEPNADNKDQSNA